MFTTGSLVFNDFTTSLHSFNLEESAFTSKPILLTIKSPILCSSKTKGTS